MPTATTSPAGTATISAPIAGTPPAATVVSATPASASPPAVSPMASPVGSAASPVASPDGSARGMEPGDTPGATVILTDYRVSVFQTTFEVGQPYTFVVENNGSETHEFVIEPTGAVDEPLEENGRRAEIVEVPAGGMATLTWTFDEPGEYQLACHRDGHYEAGMVQEGIVVTP